MLFRCLLAALLIAGLGLRGQNVDESLLDMEAPRGERFKFLGWADFLYDDSDRPGTESFHDISQIYLNLQFRIAPGWRAFAEVEYEHLPNIRGTQTKTEILLERAFIEYKRSSAMRFRLGKFNTPAGIWKPLHWAVTVDTITPPIMEENGYIPIKSVGFEFCGTRSTRRGEMNYALLASDVTDRVGNDQSLDEARALGGDINYTHAEKIKSGLSLYSYKELKDNDSSVNGVLVYFELDPWRGRLLCRSEFLALERRGGLGARAFYGKLKYQLTPKQYLNYRYDRGDDERNAEGNKRTINSLTFAYWPTNNLRIKLEAGYNQIKSSPRESFWRWATWTGYIF